MIAVPKIASNFCQKVLNSVKIDLFVIRDRVKRKLNYKKFDLKQKFLRVIKIGSTWNSISRLV